MRQCDTGWGQFPVRIPQRKEEPIYIGIGTVVLIVVIVLVLLLLRRR